MPIPTCVICGAPSKERICYRCRRRVALRRWARVTRSISLPYGLWREVQLRLERTGESFGALVRRLLLKELDLSEFDVSFRYEEEDEKR